VIATVPKEDLLVWDLKEGWEPLCKFLNKPIPDQERKNDPTILELLIGSFELGFDWSIISAQERHRIVVETIYFYLSPFHTITKLVMLNISKSTFLKPHSFKT